MRHLSTLNLAQRVSLLFAALSVAAIVGTALAPALGREKSNATESPSTKPPVPTPAAALDSLFQRLAHAADPGEAQGITSAIERLWLRSGSDTADMLMGRVLIAMQANDHGLALQLLDSLIALEPDWAEAWNKRATVRFLEHDDAGSMNDISHVLTLEPRHYGALAGMGFILHRNHLDKRALQTYRRLLEVNPQQSEIRKTVDKLTLDVEGREL